MTTNDGGGENRPGAGLSIHALRRLILTALVVSVSVSSVGVFLLVHQIFANFGPAVEKDLEWRAVRGARELSAASALGLAVSDAQTAKEHWIDHIKSPDVLAIVAVNAEGVEVARHGQTTLRLDELFAGKPGKVVRSDKYFLSWSDALVEGGSVGRLAVVIGTKRLVESQALLQKVRITTGASAFFALVGGILFITFFTRAIIKRDAQLAEYAATLEKKVEARTAELDERNRGMRLVLDNVSQGFVTVSLAGVMAPERSAVVDQWLGTPKEGQTFDSFVRPFDPHAADWFSQGLVEIAEDIMPLELLIEQLPKRVRVMTMTLAASYIPIMRAQKVENILVVLTDITAALERERLEREQKETLAMFGAISSDRSGFVDFLEDAERMVKSITEAEDDDFDTEKRLIHTLKGNAGLYGLNSVVAVCHDIESRMVEDGERLRPQERSLVQSAWSPVAAAARALLGEGAKGLVIEQRDYDKLAQLMQSGASLVALQKELASWQHEPVNLRLERLATQARQLAHKMGKPGIRILTDADGVRLDPKPWLGFWSAFVHVVRNAVDHGIEPPDTRVDKGKPAHGNLWLSARLEAGTFIVSARDDGKGIDWVKLAAKAAEKGLPANTRPELEAALFSDGVSTLDSATTVSGRGVGMAAVRQEVLDRGGKISIHSELGLGTTFEFSFPYPLASAVRAA